MRYKRRIRPQRSRYTQHGVWNWTTQRHCHVLTKLARDSTQRCADRQKILSAVWLQLHSRDCLLIVLLIQTLPLDALGDFRPMQTFCFVSLQSKFLATPLGSGGCPQKPDTQSAAGTHTPTLYSHSPLQTPLIYANPKAHRDRGRVGTCPPCQPIATPLAHPCFKMWGGPLAGGLRDAIPQRGPGAEPR